MGLEALACWGSTHRPHHGQAQKRSLRVNVYRLGWGLGALGVDFGAAGVGLGCLGVTLGLGAHLGALIVNLSTLKIHPHKTESLSSEPFISPLSRSAMLTAVRRSAHT